MKTIEQKVINFVRFNKLIDSNDKILIALSGGPDSVFALKFFEKFAGLFNIELACIHINHMLRGSDSDNDEEFCSQICCQSGIQFESVKIDVAAIAESEKKSIEDAARFVRYSEFSKTAEKFGCTKILTAHNKSDNAETVLLNLFNGSGIKGLSGIPVRRENIIRPILCLSKEEILHYLNANKIQFRIDDSNFKNDYTRNLIRNEILPIVKEKINPHAEDAISRTSELLKITSEFVDSENNKWQNEFSKFDGKRLEILITDDIYFSWRIKALLKNYFDFEASFSDYQKISNLVEKHPGSSEQFGENLTGIRDRENLVFEIQNEISFEPEVFEVNIGEEKILGTKTFHSQFLNMSFKNFNSSSDDEIIDASRFDNLRIRKWKSGDKFIPLGMKNYKKVSDFLAEQKVKPSMKANCFVLENEGEIVWVIGYRIDDRYKITENTTKFCRLWIK